MRADLALVECGLCSSRSQAKRCIDQGQVLVHTGSEVEPVERASQTISPFQTLSLTLENNTRFVSRGGQKLEGALQHTQIDPRGQRVFDFGQSTGGFTDCLLQHGAKWVMGLDVGKNQLAERLRHHSQVLCLEGLNLKTLDVSYTLKTIEQWQADALPAQGAVADLSFISLTRVLPSIACLLPEHAWGLFLVKPQFELGPQALGKNGIVKNLALHLSALRETIEQACDANHFELLNFFPCCIQGGDGNQEFFAHVRKTGSLPLQHAHKAVLPS